VPLQVYAENWPVVEVQKLDHSFTPGSVLVSQVSRQSQRIDQIFIVNDDTIDHDVDLAFYDYTTYFVLGRATVPAGAGIMPNAPFELITSVLGVNQTGVVLDSNFTLQVYVYVAPSSGKFLYINALGGLF